MLREILMIDIERNKLLVY